jgi:hypothetical protein
MIASTDFPSCAQISDAHCSARGIFDNPLDISPQFFINTPRDDSTPTHIHIPFSSSR